MIFIEYQKNLFIIILILKEYYLVSDLSSWLLEDFQFSVEIF